MTALAFHPRRCKYRNMFRTAKLPAILAALTLSVTALAGCTATDEKPAAEKPAAVKTTPASGKPTETEADRPIADACETPARISLTQVKSPGPYKVGMVGEPIDLGERNGAKGTVASDGELLSYEVATGDSVHAIVERFCVDFYSFVRYNDAQKIHPGQLLVVRPGTNSEWTPNE